MRKRLGRQLALESYIDVDIVVPVPDSGVPAAIGFAEQSGIPFDLTDKKPLHREDVYRAQTEHPAFWRKNKAQPGPVTFCRGKGW